MSERSWIDELFRKRMERRSFPVEEGEFEEVRALLRERDVGVVRGGGLSKWWLSALLPIAGLLWWAYGESTGVSDKHLSPATEGRSIQGPSGGGREAHAANGITANAVVDPSLTTVEADPHIHVTPAASVREEAFPVRGVPARTVGDVRSDPATGTIFPERGGRTDEQGRASMHTRAGDADGSGRSPQRARQPDQAVTNTGVDVEERTHRYLHDMSSTGQVGSDKQVDDQASLSAMQGAEHHTARPEADIAKFMEPRWSPSSMADAPAPEWRVLETFKHPPGGELHLFGAPLAVRTRSGTGGRSALEAGSLVGLEYRVRVKRYAWATGIHYGSYALKADQEVADVTLNFVEVPLLASAQFGRGRFGASMQGGLSVDLLFNSRGHYRVDGDRAGPAFPDGAFRTVNFSWVLRPQAIFHVSEYLSVNAGPLWKAQLGEVARMGPLAGARVSSSGIAIGITWRLDHSTY